MPNGKGGGGGWRGEEGGIKNSPFFGVYSLFIHR